MCTNPVDHRIEVKNRVLHRENCFAYNWTKAKQKEACSQKKEYQQRMLINIIALFLRYDDPKKKVQHLKDQSGNQKNRQREALKGKTRKRTIRDRQQYLTFPKPISIEPSSGIHFWSSESKTRRKARPDTNISAYRI